MKVKVLGIKETGKGFNIAHVQLGNLFGDCLAVLEITQPGEYELRSTILNWRSPYFLTHDHVPVPDDGTASLCSVRTHGHVLRAKSSDAKDASLARVNHRIEHTPFDSAQHGAFAFCRADGYAGLSIKRDYWLSVEDAESSGGW